MEWKRGQVQNKSVQGFQINLSPIVDNDSSAFLTYHSNYIHPMTLQLTTNSTSLAKWADGTDSISHYVLV